MTERGLPSADTSPACPFVAFEDERDERADRPDHRHRCYAVSPPAPRAVAHQEAYCLSSAFPVCPVFQEWARREAAHTRAGGTATPTPATATVSGTDGAAGAGGPGDASADSDHDAWARDRDQRPVEERPRRNPPRDWAAPPPWAGSGGAGGLAGGAGGLAGGAAAAGGGAAAAGGAGAAGGAAAGAGSPGGEPGTPDFLASRQAEGRGLAGSAADRLARGAGITDDVDDIDEPRGRTPMDHPSTPPDPELAGLVAGAGAGAGGVRGGREGLPPVGRPNRQPSVSSTRDRDRERERDRERASERASQDGPAWEGPRRYEAYPQIKASRSMPGMPGAPRLALLAGALVVAALALFFLPTLLGVGGGNDPSATATPTAVATPTPQPTPPPAPTPEAYVIKSGDTLSKIARAHGLTVDELLAANKDTIKDPDKIKIGDQIIIPLPTSNEVDGGATASPSP